MGHYTANKRDGNEPELVSIWTQAGAYWIPMDRTKGFDGLLAYHSGLYVVEIKDGSLSPSKKELTPHESDVRAEFLKVGVPYNVIEDRAGACDLLGLPINLEMAFPQIVKNGTRGRKIINLRK